MTSTPPPEGTEPQGKQINAEILEGFRSYDRLYEHAAKQPPSPEALSRLEAHLKRHNMKSEK